MELTTVLGVIVGVVAVVGAMIFKHIDFSVLLNPAAFFCYYCGYCGYNLEFISREEY
uniref:hypothetical protein n=1 Tax=Clostridium sp. NkU-1 TaxID=1095009 RepID=UPI00326056D5